MEDAQGATPEDAALSGRVAAYLESLEGAGSRKTGSNAAIEQQTRPSATAGAESRSPGTPERPNSEPAKVISDQTAGPVHAHLAGASGAPTAQVQLPLIAEGSGRNSATPLGAGGVERGAGAVGGAPPAVEKSGPSGAEGGMVGMNTPLRPRPRIVSVVARSAPEPVGAEVTAARVNEPAVRGSADAGMAEFIERWRASSDDSSFSRQLEERLLHVVSGDMEQARAPLIRVTDSEARTAARLVEALIAVRDGREDRVVLIEAAAEALREESGVRIPVLAACREVRGYGQYEPIAEGELVSGIAAEIVVYVEASDFRSERQADGAYLTRFELRTRVLSRSGDVVVEEHDPRIEDRCRNRRRDCFIPRLIRIPGTLPAGEYVLKVTLTDTLGGSVAEVGTALKVRAPRR
ncbi:MAG: hypothetical protein IPM64_05170 [Phycisphaerales bacterium]|nr:hypothetical protein [Phycisphaerales bacterium]